MSNVSVLSFSVATIVGLVPEILMLVYMGTTMADLTSIVTGKFEFGVWQQVLFARFIALARTCSSRLVYANGMGAGHVGTRNRYDGYPRRSAFFPVAPGHAQS